MSNVAGKRARIAAPSPRTAKRIQLESLSSKQLQFTSNKFPKESNGNFRPIKPGLSRPPSVNVSDCVVDGERPGYMTPRLSPILSARPAPAGDTPAPMRYDKLKSLVVEVEGNICSGKSTLTRNLREFVSTDDDELTSVFGEQVNNDFLGAFYSDQKRFSFAFQMYMLTSRLYQMQESSRQASQEKKLAFLDRGAVGDTLFALLNYQMGNMDDEEMEIYKSICSDCKPNSLSTHVGQLVYLDADPAECHRRVINMRKNDAEKSIPLSYLDSVDSCYFHMMMDWLGRQRGGFHHMNIGRVPPTIVLCWDNYGTTRHVLPALKDLRSGCRPSPVVAFVEDTPQRLIDSLYAHMQVGSPPRLTRTRSSPSESDASPNGEMKENAALMMSPVGRGSSAPMEKTPESASSVNTPMSQSPDTLMHITNSFMTPTLDRSASANFSTPSVAYEQKSPVSTEAAQFSDPLAELADEQLEKYLSTHVVEVWQSEKDIERAYNALLVCGVASNRLCPSTGKASLPPLSKLTPKNLSVKSQRALKLSSKTQTYSLSAKYARTPVKQKYAKLQSQSQSDEPGLFVHKHLPEDCRPRVYVRWDMPHSNEFRRVCMYVLSRCGTLVFYGENACDELDLKSTLQAVYPSKKQEKK